MPLPESGAWPPPDLAPVTERLASWSAWYSGDADALSTVYGGTGTAFDPTSAARLRNHASQYRGGVVGTLARWFWGAPLTAGERRAKLHIPLAGDIAATSAGLLFSEPPAFTLGETADKVSEDRLHELLDDTWHAMLLEAAEVCSGLGGAYLRTVWDHDLAKRPWVDVVHADNAVPEWRHGRLTAVTFWRVVEQDNARTLRHLERYEPGAILHGLYEGDATNLGRQIPLVEHSATEPFAEGLTNGDTIETGVPRLAAAYVPNMRPNRLWRTIPRAVHLGRSDYAGVEPLMDALDEVWTSWMRDIRLGKARLIVPQDYLQTAGPGQGASFNPDQELYTALDIMQTPDGPMAPITPVQFAIRVEEHSRSARELHDQIAEQCGYSAQTFGSQGDVALTATETQARQRKSFVTRGHKILYWKAALADIVEVLLAVDREQFGSKVTPDRPSIEWPDGVATDPEAQARTLQLLQAAEAVSTETKVAMLHPDWPKPRIDAEVESIHGVTGQTTANPEAFLNSAIGANVPPRQQDGPVPPQQQ